MTNTTHDTDPENDEVDFGSTIVKAFLPGVPPGPRAQWHPLGAPGGIRAER